MRALLRSSGSSEALQRVYIGMDVHQSSTTFCVLDPQAAQDGRHVTFKTDSTAKAYLRALRPYRGRCWVAFEVCPQAQWVARIVRRCACQVQVANPSRIPWLFRDGRKNDRLDARKLATLLHLGELPTVHLPCESISRWRALIQFRRALVQRRTLAKNQVRSILRTFARRCPHKSCWTKTGMVWLKAQVFDAARDLMLNELLLELRQLERRLHKVQGSLDAIAREHAGIALLRTIPGVGPRTAEAIVAYTDDVKRFKNRKQFASYYGVVPTEDSSGLVVRRGRISKRGPSVVRWVLIEAARVAIRRCNGLKAFYERVSRGRPERRKKAVVAVGRKLLAVCFGMLRSGEVYDVKRLSQPAA